MSMLPEIIEATVESALVLAKADILAPFGGLAAGAAAKYLLERHSRGDEILRNEFEHQRATAVEFRDQNQLAAAAIRYMRAVKEQAADENLRLLAQAMIGCARRHELWSSDFLKYAEILASLSRDEIILIGAIMSEDLQHNSHLSPELNNAAIWHQVTSSQLSGIFPSEMHVHAVAARAQRSGLILAVSAYGTLIYELSPIGREVRGMIDIEAALRLHPAS